MAEGSPARIDRAALERIIQRAAELQTAEREIGDTVSSEELISLGREVGIPVRYLQQALLEEQLQVFMQPPPTRQMRYILHWPRLGAMLFLDLQ